ncbi:PKD domain-containing protein [Vicingaceae bacterium]|nr:PKD domain-containing protein [Vicingaceae bacterium]
MNKINHIIFFALLGLVSLNLNAQILATSFNASEIENDKKLRIEIQESFYRQLRIHPLLADEKRADISSFYFNRFSVYQEMVKVALNKKEVILKEELPFIFSRIIEQVVVDYNDEKFMKFKFQKSEHTHQNRGQEAKGPGDPCTNMGFENCDYTGWELTEGSADATPFGFVNGTATTDWGDGSNFGHPSGWFTNDQHYIVNAGIDPEVPIQMVNPLNGGTCTAMVGDGDGTGNGASKISQTFLVDANNADFSYSYAAVFDDAGHDAAEQPFFKAQVFDQNGVAISCGDFQSTAGDGSPGWQDGNNDLKYKDWSTVIVSLQAYIGQNVTVEFTTGDCSQGGHFGYAYVEASCTPLEIIPSATSVCGAPVTLNAPSPFNGTYLWSTGDTTASITTNTPDLYTVDMITAPGCFITLDVTIGSGVAGLTPNFSTDVVCPGTVTTFTDISSASMGVIDTWYWDFNGDGNPDDSIQNPTYLFPGAGTYPVNLYVGIGECGHDTTINVIVNPIPVANFGASLECLGVATNFYDSSSVVGSNVVEWQWDFDGNGNSTVQNPIYTFVGSSLFNTTLIVTSDSGCVDTITSPVEVFAKPTASFTFSDVCFGSATNFTDQSAANGGVINTWRWDFTNDGVLDEAIQNPVNTYANSGNFTVELYVETDEGCKDSTTMLVDVDAIPFANFGTSSECLGGTTNFYDSSSVAGSSITAWQWDFNGDGLFDALNQNPTNTYSNSGLSNTTLIAISDSGCVDTIDFSVEVFGNPIAIFYADTVCEGEPTLFTDMTTIGSTNIEFWNWDFNNDAYVDVVLQNPGYISAITGTFPVRLEVIDSNSCRHDTTLNVFVPIGPSASFTFSDVCFGSATNFTDQSSVNVGVIDTWRWDFTNDGIVDNTIQNPVNTYAVSGNQTVELFIETVEGCKDSTILLIDVDAIPVANFGASLECLGSTTNFYDSSTVVGSNIVQWNWDFDGNGNSIAQNPTNIYAGTGLSYATLIVTSDSGCVDTVVLPIEVFANPIAIFSSDTVCQGSLTSFTDLTTIGSTNIEFWNWDFNNDGNNDAVLQNPDYASTITGTFAVHLEVIDSNSCKHDTTLNVFVPISPTASFSFNNVCFGVVSNFTDQSSANGGVIDTWRWDFTNDGSVDNTNQNPVNTYANSGNFTVELFIETVEGCKDSTTILVDVNAIPVANFGASLECLGNATNFYDSSSVVASNIATWQWDFNGDGVFDALSQNPNFVFSNAGQTSVYLEVLDTNGCTHDTIMDITVSENPIANFTYTNECEDTAVVFSDLSINNGTTPIDTWFWDYQNDGVVDGATQNSSNLYSSADTYTAELFVKTQLGCVDSILKTIIVNPKPVTMFTGTNECLNFETSFINSSTILSGTNQWFWSFDDLSPINNTENPSHTYASADTYNVLLTAISDSGCVDTTSFSVEVFNNPISDFDTMDVCLNVAAQFNDQSDGNGGIINVWEWDFTNDGVVDEAIQGPVNHQYSTEGIYNVSLITTTTEGCKDTLVKNVTIYPMPVANFSFNDKCLGASVNYLDNSAVSNSITTNSLVNWNWSFGDMNTSLIQNPTNLYAIDGQYDVKLVVETNNTCKDSLVQTVNVWPLPVVDFTPTQVCLNYPSQFSDLSSVSVDSNSFWSWDFGNGGTSNNQNPIYTYVTDGSFLTKLIVQTNKGCKDSLTKAVTVNPLPEVMFTPIGIGCAPNVEVNFINSSTINTINQPGTIVSWNWSFGDGAFSNTSSPQHFYQNSSNTAVKNYDVSLIATSDKGCVDTLTKHNIIAVYPKPFADFTYSPEQANDFDREISFTDLSQGGVSYLWDLDDGESSTQINPVYEYSDTGIYYVSLYIENQYGCKDSASKPVLIKPTYAIFIPNSFTPNGDGVNDYFSAKAYGIVELETLIFDRWGNNLFEGYQLTSMWSGNYKGVIVQDGVYVYKIRAKDVFGEWHEYVGKATVLK